MTKDKQLSFPGCLKKKIYLKGNREDQIYLLKSFYIQRMFFFYDYKKEESDISPCFLLEKCYGMNDL